MKITPVKSTPKDAFLQLFNIFVFYISVIGFITLYIAYISASFPDPLNYYFSGLANAVRLSSSMILIAVPAFIFTSWMLNKDIKSTPEKRELKLRKWLLYFTLFLSAITIAIDLMIFIYNFLSGELTIQFFLKILVVMMVAAGVFSYYLWDLKREKTDTPVLKYLAWSLAIFTAISFVIGLFVIGTPNTQRNRRFDEQRVTNLQYIQDQVINFWADKKRLPEKLSELENGMYNFTVPTDPETKQEYGYTVLTPTTFEICATFKSISEDKYLESKGKPATSQAYYYGNQQNWSHDADPTCFTRTIDPERINTKNAINPMPVACTMDAKICSDGTAVGRTAPDCEFAPCPGEDPGTTTVGSDKDAHGCIGSAGYTWCEAKQTCLRPWEEACGNTTTPDCPAYSPPAPGWCDGGTIIAPTKDANGCPGAPICKK